MKSNTDTNTPDMHAPDIIFDHFDKLYHELGHEKDLWKDCEDYFFSFLRKKVYFEAWEVEQVNCSISFRDYVNKALGHPTKLLEKDKAA